MIKIIFKTWFPTRNGTGRNISKVGKPCIMVKRTKWQFNREITYVKLSFRMATL
ncbi:hypothetical protein HanPI659440_Chr04g0169041 [Helianthus annuus]|nr:hypothetical protein HanIR_Chr04g0189221 [Helianthus annuus]KAJ0797019.1 hypothetical protein HanPI659440_Chr04g0169041 [Helianthus annuus]